VDYFSSGQHCAFQVSPVERDVVRDSIDYRVILARLGHAHSAELDVFGSDSRVSAVDFVYKGLRNSAFAADKYADFHCVSPCELRADSIVGLQRAATEQRGVTRK